MTIPREGTDEPSVTPFGMDAYLVATGDELDAVNVGSADWTGGDAPAGGTRTGEATITMVDGTTYTVAHAAAEVQRKRDTHAVAPMAGRAWVSFDRPRSGNPIVLDVTQIGSVVDLGVTGSTIVSGQ